ncbi:MAG: AraC family transcriptional regulator [Pseudomonadota bacterium]|nr:AraC family transcriptional regulator [Pseudomonadota bacterium]
MTAHPTNTITSAALQPLLRLLESKGFSGKDLMASGLESRPEHVSGQRIPISQFDRLLEQASKLLNQPAIGFAAGQHLDLPSFYLLGFLLSSCQTGREALTILRRYYSLISDTRSPDLFVGHQSIKVVYYVAEGSSFGSHTRTEFIATSIHTAGKAFGGHLYQVQGAGFCFPPPSYRHEMEDYFGIPLQFNQPHNWISFSARLLDQPLSQANPELFRELEEQAEKASQRFADLSPFSRKVMHILYQWPESIPITKESVADLLSTSSRTLTRRLQEENCQFSSLLRDVRLEKAKHALQFGHADVQQLAIELGFSDRRGFERAFKQWTGETPAAYRRSCRCQPQACLEEA